MARSKIGEYKWSGMNRLLENPGKDRFSSYYRDTRIA